MAAVAGWRTKEGYGDSNFLWRQSSSDVGASHVEPALKGLLEAAIAENDVELHALELGRDAGALAHVWSPVREPRHSPRLEVIV